jgi:pyridoxal 5'-phosphate synthase pdxT subunit
VTAPVIGVLALQGDVREHLAALDRVGARAVSVRRPAELELVDALVLPGGESTTMANLAHSFDLMAPLRARVQAGMPAYGSCAGMILLADRVLDGPTGQTTVGGIDMTVRRNAFGRQVDSFEADLQLGSLPGGPLHAVFIRAPWVESVGPDVQVLGTVPGHGGAARIVAVRQGPRLATSFHPELTRDDRIHAFFVEIVTSVKGVRAP